MTKFFLIIVVLAFITFILFANANAGYLDNRPSLRTVQLWVAWVLAIVTVGMGLYATYVGIKKKK